MKKEFITIRVDIEEKKKIEKMAMNKGLSVSSYIRMKLLYTLNKKVT